MMASFRSLQWCVVVALALASIVGARPGGADNDIAAETKPSETESSKAVVDPKPTNDKPAPAEVLKAVNEKYPHALLFGGTCGGTIISPNWVLTAGHCTLFTGGRYVLAGTNNTNDGSGVYRQVKRLVIHPLFTVGPYWLDADAFNFNQVAARWDFLLAELKDPLPLDGRPWSPRRSGTTWPSRRPRGRLRWLRHRPPRGTMRSEMHGMELAVQEDAACEQALVQYNKQDMVCTKGRPPRFDSACNGDSGSGLVDAQGHVVGVASWVQDDAKECRNGALVVFSRVAAVRDWIRQVTGI